jgi:hypothetical protein
MGRRSFHVHADKAGLIVDVVKKWPKSRTWCTGANGRRFNSVQEAVRALIDVPTEFVPMGCPTPKEDGTCPGHEEGAEAPESEATT